MKKAICLDAQGVQFAIFASDLDVAAPHNGRISNSLFVRQTEEFRFRDADPANGEQTGLPQKAK